MFGFSIMRKTLYIIVLAVVVFLDTPGIPQAEEHQGQYCADKTFPDLETKVDGQNRFIIIYRPDLRKLPPVKDGIEYRLDVPHHTRSVAAGDWEVPFRRHLVAVPPGARVAVNVDRMRTRKLNNVRLSRRIGDDISSVVKNRPTADFITVSEIHSFRRHRVVEVIFRPAIYDPAMKQLTLADEIRLELTFDGGIRGGRQEKSKAPLERFLLNYRQARNWAVSPAPRIGSSLPQGELFKVKVDDEGIYRIGYDDLVNIGISPSDYPLDLVRIYNNGGRELSVALNAERPDSLIELAIYISDTDQDSTFDPEDYIVFYGRGTYGWADIGGGEFQHYINHYTYDNTYWLELSTAGPPGRRMEYFCIDSQASLPVSETRARVCREDEYVIYSSAGFPNSGLDWYGDYFNGASSKLYSEGFSSVASGYYEIKLKFKKISGSFHFNVYWNNSLVGSISSTSLIVTITGEGLTEEGINYLRLEQTSPSANTYLDWYEIEYLRKLETSNSELYFESPLASAIGYYYIEDLSEQAYIFRITDFDNVSMVRGKSFTDSLSAAAVRRYCAMEESRFRQPKYIYRYQLPAGDFSDLRDTGNGADYLFITHSDFYNSLQPLVNLWTSQEGMTVKVVDIQQVFDQFSWGLYDPVAIRDFLKYTNEHWAVTPFYVTLVGDGDYDYRNILSDNDKNWIPPYEELNTCYDDFYVYLGGSVPEMALGRYTVTSASEMDIAIDKVVDYIESPEFGFWKTRITLVGDDEFKGAGEVYPSEFDHVEQCEDLGDYYIPDFFHLNKVYLTEYPVVPGAGGRQKPNAADDLVDFINRGCILVNYFGHGNEWVWADEGVFTAERDLPRIDNGKRLTYYIAATCDWAYFDYLEKQSMPEMLLVMPGRGAIASIGATRPTGSSNNFTLVKNIYSYMFEDPHNPKSGGESLMWAKIHLGGQNSEKYHIIGDPLIRPAAPTHTADVTSMEPDTLFALNLVNMDGEVLRDGVKWNDFEGTVYLEVYDTSKPVIYQFAQSESTVHYDLPGSVIFRGPFSAAGGDFSAGFIVPMDITYGGDNGRISLYFNDGQEDGCACIGGLYLAAGASSLTDSDSTSVEVYFGDRSWRPGDPVAPSPLLIADLRDTSGINLTGFPGHKIVLIVDDDEEFDLTDHFEYDIDSYRSGTVESLIDYLPQGTHTMKFRVWDSFNNPMQVEFSAAVASEDPDEEYLRELLNYPNPFKDETMFTFRLLEQATVKINIFTVGGRKIKELGPDVCNKGYVKEQFYWNGRDRMGDKVANGVYLYKVSADFSGKTVSKIGRIVVMR